MKVASIDEIETDFSVYLKASKRGPVVITREGKPVAMLVGIQDADEVERALMAHSPKLQAIVAASRQQIREGKFLTHDEFWKRVEELRRKGNGKKRKQA